MVQQHSEEQKQKERLFMNNRKKSIGERSASTKWAIEAMKKVEVGDVISYETLSEAAGLDIKMNRWVVSSAMRFLEREEGIKFGAVRGMGYKRLDTNGILDHGDFTVKRIHNLSRRSRCSLECCVNGDDLTNDQRVRLFSQRSITGLFETLTKPKKVKEIEGVIRHRQVELNYSEMLNAIKK